MGLILIGMSVGSAIAAGLLAPLQETRWAFLPLSAIVVFLAVMALSAAALIHMLRTTSASTR